MRRAAGILIFVVISIVTNRAWSLTELNTCSNLLSDGFGKSSDSTQSYINLLRSLFQSKNALSSADLKTLLSHPHVVNPFEVLSLSLPPEQIFSYRWAFDRVLAQRETTALDWEKIKSEIESLITRQNEAGKNHEDAKNITRELFIPKPIGTIKKVPELATNVNPTYFADEGKPYVSYLDNEEGKLTIIDLDTRRTEVIPVRKDSHGILSASGKFRRYIISNTSNFLRVYPVGKGDSFNIPPTISNDFGEAAIAQSAGKSILIMIDNNNRNHLWFIPPKRKNLSANHIKFDENLAYSSLKVFNFKDRPILSVGGVGQVDANVYFLDPFTGEIISKSKVPWASGPTEFYEINGELRSLVLTQGGAAVLDPMTGRVLYSFQFDHDFPIDKIAFFETGEHKFAIIPRDPKDNLEGGISRASVLDLKNGTILKRQVNLSIYPDGKLTSNISAFSFNGRTLLIWAILRTVTSDGDKIIIFDPIADAVVSEIPLKVERNIRFVIPYLKSGLSEAVVFQQNDFISMWGPKETPPLVLQLTTMASPKNEQGAVQ